MSENRSQRTRNDDVSPVLYFRRLGGNEVVMKRIARRVHDITTRLICVTLLAQALIPATVNTAAAQDMQDGTRKVAGTALGAQVSGEGPEGVTPAPTAPEATTGPSPAVVPTPSRVTMEDDTTKGDVNVRAAAPGYATSVAGVRTLSLQDVLPNAGAGKVLASQDGLSLELAAAWSGRVSSDGLPLAIETVTVSGLSSASGVRNLSFSQVIADGWSLDGDTFGPSGSSRTGSLDVIGVEGGYVVDRVVRDDEGFFQPARSGVDGTYERMTCTVDLGSVGSDSVTMELPFVMSSSAGADAASVLPLAVDISSAYIDTVEGDGTLYTGGSTVTLGDTTVYATSPFLSDSGVAGTQDRPGSAAGTGERVSLQSSGPFPDAMGRILPASSTVNAGQQEGFSVRNYSLVGVTDGTATFDSDDGSGDDSNGTNARVRSNDDIIYRTSYSLETMSGDATGDGYYLGASRVRLSATMPEALYASSGGTAAWDISAMQWLESPQVSTDGRTVTGYMTLDGSALSNPLAPRVGAMNWVLDTGWAVDGTVVATPTFTFTPEGLATTTAMIDHVASAAANMDSVSVTAKGRYNAQLEYEGDDLYGVVLQFYNADGGIKGQELPDADTPITVTLATNWNQTYLDAKSNVIGVAGENAIITSGQYGRSIPWDDGAKTLTTTFNKVYDGGEVSGSGTVDPNSGIDPGNTITLTIGDFAIDMTDTTGFRAGSGLVYADRNADATNPNQSASYDDNTTYNFGSYLFKVKAPSGYPITGGTTIGTVEIVSAAFTQADGMVSGDVRADDNVCNLTLGEYPYISGTGINHMGVVNSSQSTSYDYSRRAGLNDYGIFKLDADGAKTQVNSTASDTYTTVDIGNRIVIDTGEWFGFHSFDAGTDAAGIEVCNASNNIPRYGTLFEKFDGHVFDVDESSSEAPYAYYSYIEDYAFKQVNIAFKCVVKKGGWTDEAEQYAAHLDADADGRYQDAAPAGSGLVVYGSIADVRAAQASDAGLEIVGIVADIDIPQTVIDHIAADYVRMRGDRGAFSAHFPTLKVKDTAATDPVSGAAITDKGDARLVAVTSSDGTLRTVAASTDTAVNHTYRNWTAAGTANTGGPQDIRRISYDTTSAYTKADFDGTGTLVGASVSYNSMIEGAGTYRNYSNMSGFSYYVQLYMPYVTKGVAQSDGQAEKTGYNIDEGQRRVDFLIRSGITGSKTFGSGDTLTITDTVPSGASPTAASATDVAARWSIAYANADSTYVADASTNGGAGGTWSDDVSDIAGTDTWQAAVAYADANGLAEPSCMLDETEDGNGGTVLTWKVSDWPVGYAMPDIHYSAVLGTPDEPFTDLVNGDSLTNTASVSTAKLPNTANSSKTVTVYRQDEATAVKTSVDGNGTEYADNLRTGSDCPVAFDVQFDNEVEKQANDDISLIDVFETAAAGNLEQGYTDPADFTLSDVSFEGLNLSGCSLKLFYATESSLSATGTSAAALYADQQALATATSAYDFSTNAAWQEIDITIAADGTVSESSAAAVKAALEGQEVRAIGFSAGDLRTGSRWKLHFAYDWTDAATGNDMLGSGRFKNALAFYVNSTRQSGTTSAISLPSAPDVALTKTCDTTDVTPGRTITYTLLVANGGASPATGIFVKDYVPDNTTYVSCTGSEATYGATAAGREYVTWWIPTLAAGASEKLTMSVKVNECQSGTGIGNVALFSIENPAKPSPGTDPSGGSNPVKVKVDAGSSVSVPPTPVAFATAPRGASTAANTLPDTGDTVGWGIGLLVALGLIALVLSRRCKRKVRTAR